MKTCIMIFVLLATTCLYSNLINVPADEPTIQAGIDASIDADTVLVQQGTYVENINYNGKNITVASLFLTTQDTTYISQTIIDGNEDGSVAIFENEEDESAMLIGFTITNGEEEEGGGIFCRDNSSPSLHNLIITCNSATENIGGGICCWDDSSPSLENVTITDNYASDGGGGIYCEGSIIYLKNVSITDNSAAQGGGIWCSQNSNPELLNCIMWNNSPEEISFYEEEDPNSVTISFSDIQGGEAGIVTNNNGTVNWLEGNIEDDPLFVGTGDHSFMLQDLSPCVNAGIPDTTGLNLPEFDLAGNPRVYGGRIDMGAYENQNVVVGANENSIPLITKLNQNYPNPFNPTTTINYYLKENSKLSINIYNIKGQKVNTLVNNNLDSGNHTVIWNGKDNNSKSVSSGIYFYKMKTENFEQTKKMILIK